MNAPDPNITMTDASAPRISPWLHSSRQPRLPSSELSKQRVVLRHKAKVYHACPKTAHKRGGMSWIWEHGTELRRTNMKKPDWLHLRLVGTLGFVALSVVDASRVYRCSV
jgi:hypothetical protein